MVYAVMGLLVPSVNGGFFSKEDRGRSGPALLKLQPGVRPLGMGGAYVGLADDSNGLFWNPAGIQQMVRSELLAGHARLYEDQSQDYLAYARPLWRAGERETWGLSAANLAVDEFDLVKQGTQEGTVRPRESYVGVSYARPFRDLQWGVTGKGIQRSLAGESAVGFAADAGVLKTSADLRSSWGVTLVNVGPPMKWGGESVPLPLTIQMGAVKTFRSLEKTHVRVAVQYDIPQDDLSFARAGTEAVFPGKMGIFTLRAGAQSGGNTRYSVGAGVSLGSLSVNYALTPNDRLGDAQRVDLMLRFGRELPKEKKRRELFVQAQSAWEKGQASRAATALEELRSFSPNYYPAVQLSKKVETRLEEVYSPETLFNLGRTAQEKKQWDVAVGYYQKLVLLDPNYPEGAERLRKVSAELKAERDAQVREDILFAKEAQRRQLVQRGRVLQGQQRWEEALRAWRESLERNSREKEALAGVEVCRNKIMELAETAEKSGDLDRAVALLKALQKDEETNAVAGDVSRLEKKRMAINKQAATELYQKGVKAYDSGDLKSALSAFEDAARLNPSDRLILGARDRVRSELGLKNP